jgi:hypothetical protein
MGTRMKGLGSFFVGTNRAFVTVSFRRDSRIPRIRKLARYNLLNGI